MIATAGEGRADRASDERPIACPRGARCSGARQAPFDAPMLRNRNTPSERHDDFLRHAGVATRLVRNYFKA